MLNNIEVIIDLKKNTLNKLKTIEGIGDVKTIKLLSTIELVKRVYYDKNLDKIKLNIAPKVFDFMKNKFNDNK